MEDYLSDLCKEYYLYGVQIKVYWNHPSVAKKIHDILTSFGLTILKTAPQNPHLTLRFLTKEPSLRVPCNAFEFAQYNGLTACEADDMIYLSDVNSAAQLRPLLGKGILTIYPSSWEESKVLSKDVVILIHISLLILLRYRELYVLHAAGLARNGLSCLFIADSHCGKSTMAFSLVRQGWQYLSDDSLLLRLNGESIEALSLRKHFCLHPDAAQYFPEIVDHWQAWALADDMKKLLDVEKLYPGQAIPNCTPQLLIFPKIVSEAKSQFIPFGKIESLRRLLSQGGLAGLEPHMAPKHLEVLKRLVNQTRSYQLLAGQDLKSNPGLISQLISQVSS